MTSPKSWRWLASAYLFGAGIALILSFGLAELGHRWQHRHWEQKYWLMPLNLLRFYFLPSFALVCWGVAKRAGRPSAWLAQASGLLAACSISSAVFWYGVGVELGTSLDPQLFADALDKRILMRVVLGAAILVGMIGVVVGVTRSFGNEVDPGKNLQAG